MIVVVASHVRWWFRFECLRNFMQGYVALVLSIQLRRKLALSDSHFEQKLHDLDSLDIHRRCDQLSEGMLCFSTLQV